MENRNLLESKQTCWNPNLREFASKQNSRASKKSILLQIFVFFDGMFLEN